MHPISQSAEAAPREYKRITIANLAESSAQEVFDFICSSIIAQGKPSFNETSGACMYINKDRLRCAAGMLLNEEEAAAANELGPWFACVGTFRWTNAHGPLIRHLQSAHDGAQSIARDGGPVFLSSFADWARVINKIAEYRDIDVSVLGEAVPA